MLHPPVIPAELPPLTVMAHPVADLPAKTTLAWVVDLPVDVVGTGIVIDDRGLERLTPATPGLDILGGQPVVAVMRVLFAHDLELRNFSLKVRVLDYAVLLTRMLHPVKHLMADWVVVNTAACARAVVRLGEHVAAFGGACANGAEAPVPRPVVLVPKPDVERAEVGLDLGVLRCRVVPGITTAHVQAVKHDYVLVAKNHVLHSCLDALETGSDDGNRVRPRVPRVLEVLEAGDDHAVRNGVVVLQRGFVAPEHRELCCVSPVGKDPHECLFQDFHLCARLNWQRDVLGAVVLNLKGCQPV
mmetsp:Transcript_152237/g.369713  ORF Transcript_152237/g.369713 Transcript_152237/m.369713 type:complete len:301 (+) Transcript_152237:282-1184(+)